MSKMLKANPTNSTIWLVRLAVMLLVALEHRLPVKDLDPKVHKTSRSFCGEMDSRCKMMDLSVRWKIQPTPDL